MTKLFVATILFLSSLLLQAQQKREVDWKPPLASGGAPECPEHAGIRLFKSETVKAGDTILVIEGSAERTSKGCNFKAALVIKGEISRTIPLPNAGKQSFEIVDLSPDAKMVLLSSPKQMDYPDFQRRNVDIGLLDLSNDQLRWRNTWDVFGWRECDAMVEPQGFVESGKILLKARLSVWRGLPRPDCVTSEGLYETSFEGPIHRLSDDTKVQRYASVAKDAFVACKKDPDIIGECFNVHGRLSAWNGTPTGRIWKVGTKRILGVEDDWTLPTLLQDKMDWDVEAWGDFKVCPFTREKPGVMQRVCVESADKVLFKKR